MADSPETVGELAAALGVPLADVVAGGMWDMGSVHHDRFAATYEWDMYHEHPVASEAQLAHRRLSSYQVRSGSFSLEWYATEPDWAAPPVDPAERFAQLQAIAAAIERATTIEEAQAALGGTSLRLHPPMPVRDAARALGRPDAVPIALDVHRSHWVLRFQLGRWRVEATLDGDVVRSISAGGPTS